MPPTDTPGRSNQRRRTRKDLLQAAARLLKQGRKPSLADIAEEAMISRATAYRYFPSVDALLLEASLDVVAPQAGELFAPGLPDDLLSRVERVDKAFHEMVLANEAPLRMMLAKSLERSVIGGDDYAAVPRRQNRRSPLIETALDPARGQVSPATLEQLARALAILIGPEAMVVCKDVLQLDDADTRRVKQWAIRALVDAATSPADSTASR